MQHITVRIQSESCNKTLEGQTVDADVPLSVLCFRTSSFPGSEHRNELPIETAAPWRSFQDEPPEQLPQVEPFQVDPLYNRA